MGVFQTFFTLGLEHIGDYANGYDHILFIVALCAVYRAADWKHIVVLVTAFTIGHSLTLALAALQVVKVNSAVVEFLIPLTIFATAVSNVLQRGENRSKQAFWWSYGIALVFGLIHGLGFSNYFRSMMGKAANILLPLFAFNVGIEVGQLIIVTIIMGLLLVVAALRISHRDWNLFVSGAAAGMALLLMKDTYPW